METRNRLCRFFKKAPRFVMNTGRILLQCARKYDALGRKNLTELGNYMERGAEGAPLSKIATVLAASALGELE
jgi:hypothetical protein